ncbi:hypothetical protein B0H14DRAFT_2583603 [Mycena olivaceomarginata]|nr:hypothetical protein B0H14DRAFT_2583603 [Mycena olivaceomarginata]
MAYECYRGNLYRDDSPKLAELLERMMMHHKGRQKLFECMRPTLEEFACAIVADEMGARRRDTMLPGIAAVTTEFIEKWHLEEDVDSTPLLARILTTAAQTERAKTHNKIKKPEKLVQVVTRQLTYQSSNRCLGFQAEFGIFFWSHLVWRVQRKVSSEGLLDFKKGRLNNSRRKLTLDILKVGEAKLKSSTLGTFNKKLRAM